MRKKGILSACLILLTVLIPGCGQGKVPDTIDKPTLVITEGGKVTAYLVGELDREYYQLEELRAMAEEEAAAFNDARRFSSTVPVTVESVEMAEDGSPMVVVAYSFDKAESYTEFTGQQLLYGTVETDQEGIREALLTLKSVRDGTPVPEEQLKSGGTVKLIVTRTGNTIYCPFRVTHISDGAVLNPDGSVDTAQAEGTVYILLK